MNLKGPPATREARRQSSSKFRQPSVISDSTTAAGLVRKSISCFAPNASASLFVGGGSPSDVSEFDLLVCVVVDGFPRAFEVVFCKEFELEC